MTYKRNPGITQKEREYLDFINQFWKQNKASPSIRDIADHFQTSTSVVSYHLDHLERFGYLQDRKAFMSRAIVPTGLAGAIEEYYKSGA